MFSWGSLLRPVLGAGRGGVRCEGLSQIVRRNHTKGNSFSKATLRRFDSYPGGFSLLRFHGGPLSQWIPRFLFSCSRAATKSCGNIKETIIRGVEEDSGVVASCGNLRTTSSDGINEDYQGSDVLGNESEGIDSCVPGSKDRKAIENTLNSVVKIYTVAVHPNFQQPWSVKSQKESSGSGFAIEGQRILTNAHVIANATSVVVRKHGSPIKYMARVEHVGHECDLALLKVDDEESFWCDVPPLEFGTIPDLRDKVTVYGFPEGGDSVSLSVGVISRIELQQYAHGAFTLLALQIDAAINPGNSGGPTLQGEKVVGVAFQRLPGAENIGYIIPLPIINHFLEDIKRHNRYTGFCKLGFYCQTLENPQMRDYLHLPKDKSGVLVTKTLGDTSSVLQKDDIVMHIDGTPIANDGTVSFRNKQRIFFDYKLVNRFIGDKIKLMVWRDRTAQELELCLRIIEPLVPAHLYDKEPNYFIFAGLVFVPLVQPYLHEWGEQWYNNAPRHLTMKALQGTRRDGEEEIVVLSHVLVDEVNYGYHQLNDVQVLKFNGESIKNLAHLTELVSGSQEEFVRFDLDDDLTIVMKRESAMNANRHILQSHRIPEDRCIEK
eukprot:Nk52_evm5s291 gene=Nk52_evmTU5s291